jgi:hypothetical protein
MNNAFLDCYIWVIGLYQYWIDGDLFVYNTKKVFYYNSLNDRTFENANDNSTHAFEIQIPEFCIDNVTTELSKKTCDGLISPLVCYNIKTNKWILNGY